MTVTGSNDLLKLPGMFQEGKEMLAKISDLLEQERSAITANDLTALESVIEEKKTALTQFAQQKATWSQLISSHASSVEEFFAVLPPQAANMLRPHWEALESQMSRMQDLNERNSQIVATRNRQVSQLISVMKGHRPSSQLYTDGGSRNNYGAQSRIGKA